MSPIRLLLLLLVGITACPQSQGIVGTDSEPRDAGETDTLAPDSTPPDATRDSTPDGSPTDAFTDSSLEEDPVLPSDEAVRGLDPNLLPTAPRPCRAPILVRITDVIDGDTVHAQGVDVPFDERIRIIGVDTPERARRGQPAECYADEATTFTGHLTHHLAWLSFGAGCFDHFDRALAYVHVSAEAEGLWQRQLLRRGLATRLAVPPNTSFDGIFRADESFARNEEAGLWTACRDGG